MSYFNEYFWESELFYSHPQEKKLSGGNKASENQAWIASSFLMLVLKIVTDLILGLLLQLHSLSLFWLWREKIKYFAFKSKPVWKAPPSSWLQTQVHCVWYLLMSVIAASDALWLQPLT